MRKYINWDEYQQMIEHITGLIKKQYNQIFTIPRGGLPIATSLAHQLNIREIIINPFLIMDSTLVVDDISDSGDTLKPYQKFDIACLCYKEGTSIIPTYYAKAYKKEEWVVFPWEKPDSPERKGE